MLGRMEAWSLVSPGPAPASCWGAEVPLPSRAVRLFTSPPHPALADDVGYLWRLEVLSPLATPAVRRCTGKGSVDVVLALDGHFAERAERGLFGPGERSPYVIGPMTGWADVTSTGRCTAVGARIRPGRAAALLRLPTRELQDQVVRLEDVAAGLGPVDPDALREPGAAVAYLERVLLELHLRAGVPDLLVGEALRLAGRADGDQSVRALAGRLGSSPRQLERRFREHVGLSPKVWSRIARLDRAVGLLAGGAPVDAGDLVAAGGFYDQAHLIREFRDLAGTTPGAFLRSRQRCRFSR